MDDYSGGLYRTVGSVLQAILANDLKQTVYR